LPGLLVFGVGVAITSGINNAVSRTAGVLAIAIVGALALFVFGSALDRRTATLGLPAPAIAALQADAARLGAARVPVGVTPEQSDAIRQAIRLAFVDAYRVLMFVCTGLAWLGAAMAALLVRAERVL
jgi:hypothetical protein